MKDIERIYDEGIEIQRLTRELLAANSAIYQMREELAHQHNEILSLRMYAPGQHVPHVVKVIPQIAPTNFAFYGMADVETDFDSFGHQVPNESEA